MLHAKFMYIKPSPVIFRVFEMSANSMERPKPIIRWSLSQYFHFLYLALSSKPIQS